MPALRELMTSSIQDGAKYRLSHTKIAPVAFVRLGKALSHLSPEQALADPAHLITGVKGELPGLVPLGPSHRDTPRRPSRGLGPSRVALVPEAGLEPAHCHQYRILNLVTDR